MKCKATIKTKICTGCEHNKEHTFTEECKVRCKAHYEHSKCGHMKNNSTKKEIK